MIKHINSFSGISPIKPNTLVVLDIDDTIISFPNIHKDWWNETYTNLYYYDKQNAYKQTNLLWLDRIVKSKPSLIDKKNFNKFLEQISQNNCELIFLTARDENIAELTINQLKYCNIDINPTKVFYNRHKGKELEYIVRNIYPNVKNIVFVDDLIENLINVAYTFNTPKLFKYNLELYKIKHKTYEN